MLKRKTRSLIKEKAAVLETYWTLAVIGAYHLSKTRGPLGPGSLT